MKFVLASDGHLIYHQSSYSHEIELQYQILGAGVMNLVTIVTRTEGISVRVIRMLSQLVGFGPVERANVKFTKKCMQKNPVWICL